MLGVNPRYAGLISGKEARQLICRKDEVESGDSEEHKAEEREDDFHGITLMMKKSVRQRELEPDLRAFVKPP
jgi:hypothetical protein